MSVLEKLIQKVFRGSPVTFAEAEKILFYLGYKLTTRGSHYCFRKKGRKQIVLKRRSQLKAYQIRDLKEVLISHGYTKQRKKEFRVLS